MHENLDLRQRLIDFNRTHPQPRLGGFDKLFWIRAQEVLDWVETGAARGEPGNQLPLGPCGLSTLMEPAIGPSNLRRRKRKRKELREFIFRKGVDFDR